MKCLRAKKNVCKMSFRGFLKLGSTLRAFVSEVVAWEAILFQFFCSCVKKQLNIATMLIQYYMIHYDTFIQFSAVHSSLLFIDL